MLVPVTTIDDPRLEPYRELNQRNLTRQSGLFIAEGEKVVERLIESRFETVSVLAEPAYAQRYEPRVQADVPIYVASRALLQETIGFHFHRGILACGRRQRVASVEVILEQSNRERVGSLWRNTTIPIDNIDHRQRLPTPLVNRSTIVVCPDVQDPTNLGSIIRSAAAFGCAAAVLGSKCADPFSRRVLRVSMGAALTLPIVESHDLASDLSRLADANFELVAAVIDPSAEPLSSARRPDRLALLLGSEGHGLSEEWLALAHRRVTIPMQVGIDSLNVAVAAAVLLYHFCSDNH